MQEDLVEHPIGLHSRSVETICSVPNPSELGAVLCPQHFASLYPQDTTTMHTSVMVELEFSQWLFG